LSSFKVTNNFITTSSRHRKFVQTTADSALVNMQRAIKTEATEIVYLHRIGEFKAFMEAHDYTDLLKDDARTIENSIISYVDSLSERGLAAKTIRLAVSAVRLFYVSNRVALNWEWLRSMLPAIDKVAEDRLYTTDELNAILQKCDERKRVMFLLLLSTGMRIGGLPGLKVGDLEKIEKYGLYSVRVYSGTKERYTSFTTPEAAQAIDYYLDYRRRRGERITPSSPLIRKQFSQEKANEVESMTLEGCIAVLDDLIYDAGVRQKGDGRKRKQVMRFHAWRKACNSAMIKAGVHPFIKEKILGHTVGLDNSYGRLSDDELLEGYLKAVPLLTISEEPKLKEEVERLKVKVENIDELRQRYLDIKKRLDEYENPEVINFNKGTRRFLVDFAQMVAKNPKVLEEFRALSEKLNEKAEEASKK